ncbi:MAG TPA: FtsQ-type POTRA domain-containing protein [Polyangiaceae bacterium]
MKNRRVAPSIPPEVDEPPVDGLESARTARWVGPLRTVGGFVLVASVSLAVAWGSRRYLMTSARFSLEQVVMSGQKTRTKDALLARAGIKMGQNVFSIDLDAARNKMLGDPYVKNAVLSRRLPDTIAVDLEERVPAAVVSLGKDTFLVTRDGETFKHLEIGDPSDLPVITGLEPELAETDRDAFADAVRRALDVAVDYQQSPLASKMPLQEIHFEPGSAISLDVGSPVTTLVLGGPPFRKKLDQAARVAFELERRGQKPDAILLDNDARPERVVARVR